MKEGEKEGRMKGRTDERKDGRKEGWTKGIHILDIGTGYRHNPDIDSYR
jgi:hypothetical protein